MLLLGVSRPETHKKAIPLPIPFNWRYLRLKSGQKREWMLFLATICQFHSIGAILDQRVV
jgi:hypothetical protein